jgi:protein TonB
MNRQTKAVCGSLLLHAVCVLGAATLIRPPETIRPPVVLDFSIRTATAGPLGRAAAPPAAARPRMEKSPSRVKKKTVPPKPKQTAKPPPEVAPAPETVPVAVAPTRAPANEPIPTPDTGTGPAESLAPSVAAIGSGNGGGNGGDVFSTGALDRQLIVLRRPPPVYPQAAKSRHIEGWIKVQFVVDERGQVEQIEVLAAEPQAVFDQSVLRCVAGWRFKPGTVGGRAVKARVQQTIRFQLD